MSRPPLILVTGGGGFLGRRIVASIQQTGWRARIFGRNDHPDLRNQGVEIHCGDVRDTTAVDRACSGVDGVVHNAGHTGVRTEPEPYFPVNVEGTRNVLDACRRHEIRKLVFSSSPSVVAAWGRVTDADESLPYPARFPAAYPESKAQAERLVLEAADGWMGTCALRPHLLWGVGDPHFIPRLVKRAKQGRLMRIGNGTNRVSLTHVDNAARAYVSALAALDPDSALAGRAYFIVDATPVLLWEWINDLFIRLGLPTVHRAMSMHAASMLGAVADGVRRFVPLAAEPRISRFLALQLGTNHCFSSDRAREDFGYHPHIANDHGKKELIQWLLTQPS